MGEILGPEAEQYARLAELLAAEAAAGPERPSGDCGPGGDATPDPAD